MKIRHYFLMLLTATPFIISAATAQDDGFIYGKIYTEDGQTYEGPIRWGKEEVYWTDIFNAQKEKNEYIRHLSDDQRDALEDRQNHQWFNWSNGFNHWTGWHSEGGNNDFIHQFSCQFGEIKTITPQGKEYVEIELQNGSRHEVSGEGYNDVGLDVRIADKEIGEMDVRWSRIQKIEFMNTPSSLPVKFGQPLYGTVEAFGEKFTGYIQWDHDERLSTDKLDGSAEDGKVSIEFGKIRSIERRGNRSVVIMKSGREFVLGGSNDVSSGHRGVIVENKEFPSINIPWDEFDKVVFEDKTPGPVATYSQFKNQEELQAKVTTQEGKTLSGRIIYDLDEAYNFELLQGKEGEFEYTTPFRNVKKITTKGEYRCTVELRTGKKINLDDAQDVNERNQGVLVFAKGQTDPTYIAWEDVSEIEFL